ncbi:hypothetical protein QBC43DRAFT_297029 [Cladorrhinum sp. PSN259]|nr:hypothetical protein QBC43DRAFT_297029 [Cladorrhinum sp. PSN259]
MLPRGTSPRRGGTVDGVGAAETARTPPPDCGLSLGGHGHRTLEGRFASRGPRLHMYNVSPNRFAEIETARERRRRKVRFRHYDSESQILIVTIPTGRRRRRLLSPSPAAPTPSRPSPRADAT